MCSNDRKCRKLIVALHLLHLPIQLSILFILFMVVTLFLWGNLFIFSIYQERWPPESEHSLWSSFDQSLLSHLPWLLTLQSWAHDQAIQCPKLHPRNYSPFHQVCRCKGLMEPSISKGLAGQSAYHRERQTRLYTLDLCAWNNLPFLSDTGDNPFPICSASFFASHCLYPQESYCMAEDWL